MKISYHDYSWQNDHAYHYYHGFVKTADTHTENILGLLLKTSLKFEMASCSL